MSRWNSRSCTFCAEIIFYILFVLCSANKSAIWFPVIWNTFLTSRYAASMQMFLACSIFDENISEQLLEFVKTFSEVIDGKCKKVEHDTEVMQGQQWTNWIWSMVSKESFFDSFLENHQQIVVRNRQNDLTHIPGDTWILSKSSILLSSMLLQHCCINLFQDTVR